MFGALKRLFSSGSNATDDGDDGNDVNDVVTELNDGLEEKAELGDELEVAYEDLETAIDEYQSTGLESDADRIGTSLCEIRDRLNELERHTAGIVETFDAEFGDPHEEPITVDMDLRKLYDELEMELESVRREKREIQTDVNAYEDDVDGYVEVWSILETDSDEEFAALASDDDVMAAVNEFHETYAPDEDEF
ncbi:hypothetical protein [Natrialba swarupiae]|uniref:Uncharacterized protein n=1 Tax=Natrialba swarupiae TaxID=2448032 RepID=A0A5D5AQ91_9EURY|nr:hypothetical protein [Natrialba swarupiae]TYT63147.1 hypothetical protein FYC77_03475 [Natrialba swarupiae]